MLLTKDQSLVLLVDVQEKLTPLVLNPELLIKRCEWLLKLAHKLDVPIFISEQYVKGLGSTLNSLSVYRNSKLQIDKLSFSCYQHPSFKSLLNSTHKNQLILVGIEAHVCVLQSALDLKYSGYEVFVVVDAISSRHEIDLKYALQRMQQAGIHLITSEMIFFEWLRNAGSAEFKTLSKEFL